MRPAPRHALVLALAAAGCGPGSPAGPREPDGYFGCSTDENRVTFDDERAAGRIKSDDSRAPLLTMPAVGSPLPGGAAPRFAWQPTPTAPGKPSGDVTCQRCSSCGALTTQHEPPISGNVYDLQFSVDGKVLYRALTTTQSLPADMPPPEIWKSFRGKSVALAITRLQVKANDVADGPYQGTKPLTFTVAN